jgi:hypothetical protein
MSPDAERLPEAGSKAAKACPACGTPYPAGGDGTGQGRDFRGPPAPRRAAGCARSVGDRHASGPRAWAVLHFYPVNWPLGALGQPSISKKREFQDSARHVRGFLFKAHGYTGQPQEITVREDAPENSIV